MLAQEAWAYRADHTQEAAVGTAAVGTQAVHRKPAAAFRIAAEQDMVEVDILGQRIPLDKLAADSPLVALHNDHLVAVHLEE